MPALLAYLIALCLLIGGGFSALGWLAAPDPVKLAAKASPNSKLMQVRPGNIATLVPQTPASAEPHPFPDAEKGGVSSINPREYGAETAEAAVDQDMQQDMTPKDPERGLTPALAEVPSDKVNRTLETNVRADIAAARASIANVKADMGSRTNRKHANSPTVKRKLELMTLRTIEFADGHQVTQLIPYRGRRRALAFGVDE